MELYLLTFTLFLLQIADWYTTATVLNKGGIEQNPIMREFFKCLGVNKTLAIKTALVTYLGLLIGQQYLFLLTVLVILYIFVIIHNWKSL